MIKKSVKTLLMTLAADLNFYGKRLTDTRLECAERMILENAEKLGSVNGLQIVQFLLDNKPEKPAKAERVAKADQRPAANTMIGNSSKRELPVIETAQRVIVVGAQNNTGVNAAFFSSLQSLASDLNAQLVVLPIHYNLKAFSAAVEDNKEYFDPLVKPYLAPDDHWLFAENAIRLAPSANVLPTAKFPINAASSLNSGELFTVIPSTKQQLRTLPRMLDQPIRQAWSTGVCTVYNYTETRSGAEAEADHVFGALLCTLDNLGQVHVTNIRQGSSDDLQLVYPIILNGSLVWEACGITDGSRPAIKLGDLHCEMFDPLTWDRTLDLLTAIDPAMIAVDDIIHFSTMSHHQRHNATHLYRTKGDTVFNDLYQVISQLNQLAEFTDTVYVTESNHNSAVCQWIADGGFKPESSPQNAKLFYLIKWMLCDAIDNDQELPAYQLALQQSDLTGLPALSEKVIFGRMDRPYIVNGYDFSQHGHKGNNGSQGSHNLISKSGLSLVTGHTHSAAITGRLFTTGVTASLHQGYNRGGGSSWCHSHVIAWPSGECQTINVDYQTV